MTNLGFTFFFRYKIMDLIKIFSTIPGDLPFHFQEKKFSLYKLFWLALKKKISNLFSISILFPNNLLFLWVKLGRREREDRARAKEGERGV